MTDASMSGNTQMYYINYSNTTHHHGANCQASCADSAAQQMFDKYGTAAVLQAVTNAAADYLGNALNDMINNADAAGFMKDDAKALISQLLQMAKGQVPSGAQDSTNQALQSGSGGKSADDIMSGVMKMLQDSMQQETSEASSGNGKRGGGKGNWLAILARALGSTAGQHLKNMVELGEKMGSIDSKENPEQFAETQAEFQAQAQIFKMFQEAIGTMVKSIGEGMSSVARKQ